MLGYIQLLFFGGGGMLGCIQLVLGEVVGHAGLHAASLGGGGEGILLWWPAWHSARVGLWWSAWHSARSSDAPSHQSYLTRMLPPSLSSPSPLTPLNSLHSAPPAPFARPTEPGLREAALRALLSQANCAPPSPFARPTEPGLREAALRALLSQANCAPPLPLCPPY